MKPAADGLALASIAFDTATVAEGMAVTVKWRGKPVFVRHRTAAEIEQANAVPLADLPDPQADAARTLKPEILILVGVCTHLGCVPLGQKPSDPRRSEEHTSELQSLMRISYAVFCLQKKTKKTETQT